MKVLFCSPYLKNAEAIKGGINTWGRYIMEYYKQYGKKQVCLIPISLDRSSYTATSSLFRRIRDGYSDQMKSVKEAIHWMELERPNVVHICTSAGLGLIRDYLLVRAAKKRGVKSIVHLHFGRIPILAKQRNWEWRLLSKVLNMCDIPVVMNRPSEKVLIEEGFNNVTYLPNPLGMSALEAIHNAEGRYERIPRRLLYCGHVSKTKGVMELVDGCSRIPNIELRIVGKYTSEIKEEMQAMAKNRKHDTSWLNFIGEVSHEDVIHEFYQADMFVFPSYSEGFPNVILEAMACGCPIVSSDVGAIPEMLDIDGSACGICFKPQSADEVFRTVSSIIDNNELKSTFALKAKARVNEFYAIPKVWKQMVTIWNNASTYNSNGVK